MDRRLSCRARLDVRTSSCRRGARSRPSFALREEVLDPLLGLLLGPAIDVTTNLEALEPSSRACSGADREELPERSSRGEDAHGEDRSHAALMAEDRHETNLVRRRAKPV